MMTDFGRVGHLSWPTGESTFMVVGPSSEPIIRAKVKDYRQTVILMGSGWWGDGIPIEPGAFAPIHADDDHIEWLDE